MAKQRGITHRSVVFALWMMAILQLPTRIVGPAVPPLSFVTLESDSNLVGGAAGGVDPDIPCCKDENLASCVRANIDPTVLGRKGSLVLPNDIVVTFAGHVGSDKRSFSYKGEDGALATITCSANLETGGCHGGAVSADGDTYSLEYCGEQAGHVFKQLITSNLLDEEPVWDQEDQDSLVGQGLQAEEEEELDLTKYVEYSIKFYYTEDFAAVTPDIDGFIDNAVTVTNLAYINSGVPLAAYALCKEEATGLKEIKEAKPMLDAFGKFKNSIEELRDTADVAVLFVNQSGSCGIGRVASFHGGDTIALVKKSCAESVYTVAHEVGHIFGLMHDPDPENPKKLPYPYGTGHLIETGQAKNTNGFRSIMAYSAEGHLTRINFFSSPDLILKETLTPTGNATSDNRRVLLLNRFRVAAVGDESSSRCSRTAGEDEGNGASSSNNSQNVANDDKEDDDGETREELDLEDRAEYDNK